MGCAIQYKYVKILSCIVMRLGRCYAWYCAVCAAERKGIWRKRVSLEDTISYQNLIDREELQRLQDSICASAGVCAYAVDAMREKQTAVSGAEGDVQSMFPYLSAQLTEQILSRVEKGSLEEYVVEDTEAVNLKAAAVSVRIKGETVLNWIVLGVVSDKAGIVKVGDKLNGVSRSLKEQEFYRVLDLFRESSLLLFRNRLSRVSAEAENLSSRYLECEAQDSLDRIEALTGIAQLAEHGGMSVRVMKKALAIAGAYLRAACGYVCRLHTEEKMFDILADWYQKGAVSPFGKEKISKQEEALFSEKPVVNASYMVFPLCKGEEGMCLCFCREENGRSFTMQEVRFAADVTKLLQTMLAGQKVSNPQAETEAWLAGILDNVCCGIYVKDKETGEVLFANKRLKRVFSEELADGAFEQFLESFGDHKEGGLYEVNDALRERWYDLLHAETTWIDGREVMVYSLYDITDKKLHQEKIEKQAYTDLLTGLYNRICCERDLAWYLDDAKRRAVKGGLLYIDLDDFKHINDGLGHQYGDVLLKEISGALSHIEGIRTTCYRMGGDEFVIVVPPENFSEFEKIIAEIQAVFAKPWNLRNREYYCTMSMGVVTFPDDGDNVQEIIQKADIAMYEAKNMGKNRYAHYSDSLGDYSGRRLDMEKNMRDAAVAGYGEFEVYYQPIIDISQPAMPCTGAEALIRWNSATLGFISPAEFIPLAEYLGLINPIGSHVLQEACRECKKWNDNGYPGYKVNVNLSVVQLLQPDIVETIRRTLVETGVKPHNLTLEVTESLAINDMVRMKEILTSIKGLGVRIALDDFGTGYSSLNHIREIPFDVIKVDQSFVRDLAEDAYSQSFIKMVAELAETIGVSICVEGIETEEQYRVLEGMKVRMVQGYYFDRPMPRKEFEKKYI